VICAWLVNYNGVTASATRATLHGRYVVHSLTRRSVT